MQEAQTVAISAIAGMGGVGKTELALQYALARLTAKQYTGGICWLNARTGDVGIQIVNFARTHLKLQLSDDLELPDRVAYCWRFWHTSPTLLIKEGDSGQVLVVLDDVTKYEDVKPYLPPTDPRFKVLMTTRLQLGKPIKRLDLEVLTEGAALAMLRSYIGDEWVDSELDVAEKLCNWLGYLPLGLELVGRYLARKADLSLEEMLARLKAKQLKQLALKKTEAPMTAKEGVQSAFELSWQELDEPAKQLGLCLSLFAVAPIPWKLVEKCLPDIDSEELEDIRDFGLVNLNLVMRKGKNTYQLHELIREFFLDKREESAEVEGLKRVFCQAMVAEAEKIPDAATQSQITVVTPTIPHLAEAATTQIDWVSDEDLILPFLGLAKLYKGQGDYKQAEPWFEQCLSSTKARLGANHPHVAGSLNNLAELYRSQGRYEEAEPLFLQALELSQRLLVENHPDVATSLNNLALLYDAQGRYEEAEPLYLQALKLYKRLRLLGANHPHLAGSLNNLALLYYSQGRYTEAEPLYLQALKLWQRNLGENHPYVATSLNNLALLYYSQGRYTEAEPLFLQALEWRQRNLGENHPDVAQSLNNLAGIYYSQGRYTEAERLFLQALELCERVLELNHPNTVSFRKNLQIMRARQAE